MSAAHTGKFVAYSLTLCRLHGATLIIAMLDRLARNVGRLRALRDYLDLAPIIGELQAAGAASLRAIAAGLNERGIPTARGGQWTAIQVSRVLNRPTSAS